MSNQEGTSLQGVSEQNNADSSIELSTGESPLLIARDIHKSYRTSRRHNTDVKALRGVNIELSVGKVVALVGESGSGKSTIGRILAGQEAPTSGDILFDGQVANFLGVGNTTTWSLGTILYWAQNGNALQLGAWWWFAIPGVIIALIGTGLVLLNFGLDEIGNPRLRDSNSSIKVGGRRVRPSDPTPVLIGEAAGFVAKSKSHKGWRSSQASTDETTGETGEKLGDSVSLVATIAGSNGELRSDDAMGSGDNLIKSSIEADAHGSTSERKGA